MMPGTQTTARTLSLSLLLGSAIAMAGCGQFFPPLSGGGSSGGGGSSTVNAVYALNSNVSLESVAAFSLSSGKLTSLGVSPTSLSTPLTSLAINPAGTLLYTGTLISGIYVYIINSDGSLTLGNSNGVVASTGAGAMVVDPSGKWLLSIANNGTGTAPVLTDYSIDATNGSLTTGGSVALDTGTAYQIVFAPNGTQAWVSLATGGIDSLQFNASTGVITKLGTLVNTRGNGFADYGLAVDPSGKYLYAAETGGNGVRAFTINSNSSLTEISGSPFSTGQGPVGLMVDSTGAYVYATNRTDGTISAYTRSSTTGALTAMSGSPFSTCGGPDALAEDTTHAYLEVACASSSPDLQIYSIAATTATVPGALTSTATASTGSDTPQEATQLVSTP